MAIAAAEPFLILEVEVAPPSEPGDVGAGARRFIPIVGGRVSGAVEGEILPGGADWQTIHADGNLQIEAHYAFRTTGGAVVEVISTGVRSGPPEVLERLMRGEPVDAKDYYFRTFLRLRTGAPELKHLNWTLAVARGERRKGGVRLEAFAVL